MPLLAGIEAGGTKIIAGIGDELGNILEEYSIPTNHPDISLTEIISWLEEAQKKYGKFDAMGLGFFGALDPHKGSPTYGHVTSTPKLDWRNTDVVSRMKKHFNIPMEFDTDVNAAALGEYYWGHGQDLDNFIYITIGTGIGAGIMANGKLLHGAMHPEAGHQFIYQDKNLDPFDGICPYHNNCWEGLACGPAMQQRWNVNSARDLAHDHEAWDLEAKYISYGLANLCCVLSPKKFILGGGVMSAQNIINKIRQEFALRINNYLENNYMNDLENFIVEPKLGRQAGLCGAIALACHALECQALEA